MGLALTNHNQVTVSGAHHTFHLPRNTYPFGSCDGLVLALSNPSQAFLINPTTRHTKEIPRAISDCISDPVTSMKTITLNGIGFDPVTHDYKVVCVAQIYNSKVDDSSHELFVNIYSVNEGTWKRCISLQNVLSYRFEVHWLHGVFVGRCIHWLIRRETDGIIVIIAFDVVEEKLCQVPSPKHCSFEEKPYFYSYRLCVVAGCLCVSTLIGGYVIDWVMNKYGIQESWTRIARIGKIKKVRFDPLCFVGQENLVLDYHKGLNLEKLVIYNVTEKKLKDVDIPNDIRDLDYYTVPFAETMVSPYGLRGEC